MVSTVDDIYCWARCLRIQGHSDRGQEAVLLDHAHDYIMKHPAFGSSYCGLGTNKLKNKTIRGHDGQIGIFSSSMTIYKYHYTAEDFSGFSGDELYLIPRTLTVVALANYGNAEKVAEKISALFEGKKLSMNDDLREIADARQYQELEGVYGCDEIPGLDGLEITLRVSRFNQLIFTQNSGDDASVVLLKSNTEKKELFGSNFYGFTLHFERDAENKIVGATLTADDFGVIPLKKK